MNRTRPTSLLARSEVVERLAERQAAVLAAISAASGPVCDVQIAEHLGWPINCVTPRRGELIDLGVIEDAGQQPWRGRRRHFWRPSLRLFAGREWVPATAL